jgi:hypothetical protein
MFWTPKPTIQRRIHSRSEIPLQIRFGNEVVSTLNWSLGGFLIKTATHRHKGTRHRIQIEVEDVATGKAWANAECIRSYGGRSAFRFKDLSKPAYRALRQLISEKQAA